MRILIKVEFKWSSVEELSEKLSQYQEYRSLLRLLPEFEADKLRKGYITVNVPDRLVIFNEAAKDIQEIEIKNPFTDQVPENVMLSPVMFVDNDGLFIKSGVVCN